MTITLSPAPTEILMAIATSNTINPISLVKESYPVVTNILTSNTFSINSVVNTGAYAFSWFAIAQA
jgi:hypothetical protein